MDARRPTAEEARRALDAAPRTETGIIIPPHVAEAIKQDERREYVTPPPNRAQRRAARKLLPRDQRIAKSARAKAPDEISAALAELAPEERERLVRAALAAKEAEGA